MAFANLFLGLATVDEDVRTPDRSDITCRNKTENGTRGRKRKPQVDQPCSYRKKRCYLSQTITAHDALKDIISCNTKAKQHHQQGTSGQHRPVGNTKEMINDNNYNAGNNGSRCHKKQKSEAKNKCHVYNKQQKQGKKMEKNQQQRKHGGRPENRDERLVLRKAKRTSKDAEQVKRFMTQEFKDQNALLVDGRLLCRHFIWGRCIKADDCQLEHIQAYNDLIKEVCKFYVQGCCTKGQSCPYMHKSFPCKHFHRKGNCSQKEVCRFSHEPLNEVTERLLDEAIKREKELRERSEKAEKSLVQPTSTEVSELINMNREPDVLEQPLRPQFYNSTGAEETSVFQTDEPASGTDKCASDAANPQSSPPTSSYQQEPACYSVEAMLGPQLSRPFPSFFNTPGRQESTPVSASQGSSAVTEGTTNQSEVPYSVDAVLRSYKSVENSACGQTPTFSKTQSVIYTPTFTSEKITAPLLSSENRNQKVSLSTRDEENVSQEKMFKSLSSPRVCTGLKSKARPHLSHSTRDHEKWEEDMSERQKGAQITSDEVKPELLGSLVTEAEKSVSPESKFDAKESMRHTCSPKGHTQLKPHLSSLTCDSATFRKTFSSSSGYKKFKGRAAAPVGPVKTEDSETIICHLEAKQLAGMHQNNKKGPFTPKPGMLNDYSSKNVLDCKGQILDGIDSSAGCNKTQERPFRSLFGTLTSDSMIAPAHPQDFIQSPQSVDIARDKTSTASFLSLFTVPPCETPASVPILKSQTAHSTTSCRQQSAEETVLHSKHGASDFRSPLLCQARTDAKQKYHGPGSPEFSPDPENDRPSTGLPQQQLPDISSPRDSAGETSTNSVLNTLFLSLRPYEEDGEKQDSSWGIVHSEEEKKSHSVCVFFKQQQKSKRKRQKKRRKNMSAVKVGTDSAEHQPWPQTTRTSSEVAGVLRMRGAGLTKPQVRNSDTRTFPFKPGTPLLQHPTHLRMKQTSEEGDWRIGNVVETPFKDLFKTLDMI